MYFFFSDFLSEEAVFVDFLEQCRQHIPRLSTLLNRLKTIPVPDPLLDWEESLPAKEILFRYAITQNVFKSFFLDGSISSFMCNYGKS